MIGALLAAVATATPAPVWEVDLALSDGGLVSGGETDQWGWADPAAGPVGLGPCWGTNPDALYLHDTVDWLEVQLPDLAVAAEPSLVIRHWYAVANGDFGVLELDDGGGFAPIAPVYGYPAPEGFVGRSSGYVDAVVDLRGRSGAPRLRFTFTSDAALADAGWYVQRLALFDGDVVAPTLIPVIEPADTQDVDGPYRVELDIADDRGVQAATVRAEIAGDGLVVPMTAGPGDRWTAELPGQPPDTVVTFHVEATDGQNVGRWPADEEAGFRVFLAAPTGLRGPDRAHLVATEVELTWSAPDSPHPVLGYHVHRELGIGPPIEVQGTTARVPVADPQRYWVEAVYEAGVGDPSEVLQLDVEVPRLDEVRPAVAFQGQQLYVHVSGSSLYLLDGAASLDLGPEVRVVDLDVLDVNSAVARVEIAPDAVVGSLPVAVEGTAGRFVFPDRFRIRDGSDAPHIVRISPDRVKQGQQVTLEIEASVPFVAVPTVGVGEDLVVTGDVEVEDATVARVGLAVSGSARLGLHSLALDDGEHLYTVDLEVEETVQALDPGCRCAGGGAWRGPGGLLVAAALARLRRRSGTTAPSPGGSGLG